MEIPLPPLAEQKRIVAKIEELLARVNPTRERLVKVPAILKRFRQAVLAAACTGNLTKSDESDFPNVSDQDVPKPDEELVSVGQLHRIATELVCRTAELPARPESKYLVRGFKAWTLRAGWHPTFSYR